MFKFITFCTLIFGSLLQGSLATHVLYDAGTAGDWVQFEDGSKWSVAREARYEVNSWWLDELVTIAPSNARPGYRFAVINQSKGTYVYANLKSKPLAGYAKHIVSIDYYTSHVYLCDGSYWYISMLDRHLLSHWYPGDKIVVGISNDCYEPYILINTSTYNAEWAACSLCY